MTALAIWTPDDGPLGVVAPLGIGAAAPEPTLVVDLDVAGPRYPGTGSLAELVADGPRRSDLAPGTIRRGTAVLRNGGVTADEAGELLGALVRGWGSLVLRLPPRPEAPIASVLGRLRIPVVPVVALLLADAWPDRLGAGTAAVMQQTGGRSRPNRPGPVLPRPARGSWDALLAGRIRPGDRWVRALRSVWEFPWR